MKMGLAGLPAGWTDLLPSAATTLRHTAEVPSALFPFCRTECEEDVCVSFPAPSPCPVCSSAVIQGSCVLYVISGPLWNGLFSLGPANHPVGPSQGRSPTPHPSSGHRTLCQMCSSCTVCSCLSGHRMNEVHEFLPSHWVNYGHLGCVFAN